MNNLKAHRALSRGPAPSSPISLPGKLLTLKRFQGLEQSPGTGLRPKSNSPVSIGTVFSPRIGVTHLTPMDNCDKLKGCALPRGNVI
jgi:hypothetical protein